MNGRARAHLFERKKKNTYTQLRIDLSTQAIESKEKQKLLRKISKQINALYSLESVEVCMIQNEIGVLEQR